MKRMNFTFLLLFALLSFVSFDLNAQATSSSCIPEVNISVDAQCGFVVNEEVLGVTGPAAMAESITYAAPGGLSGTTFPGTGSITGAGSLGLPKGGGTVQYTLWSGPGGTGSMLCWGDINFEVKLTPEPVYARWDVMCSVAPPELPSLDYVTSMANGQCSAEISNITESNSVSGDACTGFRTIRDITGTVNIDGAKSVVLLRSDTIVESPLDTSMVVCPAGGPDFDDAIKLSCEALGGAYPEADAIYNYFYILKRRAGYPHAAAHGLATQYAYPHLNKGTGAITVISDIEEIIQETVKEEKIMLNGLWVLVDVVYKDTTYDTTYADIPYPLATPLPKGTTCNLSVKCTDMQFPGCAGPESKIMRTWQVLDWCNGSIKECMQWIVVEPSAPYFTSVLGKSVLPTRRGNIPFYDMWPRGYVGVNIAPWTCAGQLDLSATAYASCAPGYDISWSTTAGVIGDDNVLRGLWLGENAEVTATVVSDCGSHGEIAKFSFTVVPLDNILPVPIAEDEINVSLTGDPTGTVTPDGGVAKVYVDAIDAGSHNAGCGEVDKCLLTKSEYSNPVIIGGEHVSVGGHLIYYADSDCRVDGVLEGRPATKLYPGIPDIPYVYCKDFVKVCCSDLGTVQVALVVTNGGGRTSHSWTDVHVEDKSRAVYSCHPGAVLDCGQAYNPYWFAPQFQSAVCEVSELTYTVAGDADACGDGLDVITWSLDGEVICQTPVRFSGVSAFNPYEIKWPKHYTGEVEGGVVRECELWLDADGDPVLDDDGNEQYRIVEYASGVAMGAAQDCELGESTGEPVWCQAACSLVGSNFETLEVEAANACKKIIRRWTVIDWCTWEANGSDVDDENDSTDDFQAVDDEWLDAYNPAVAGQWYTDATVPAPGAINYPDGGTVTGLPCATCEKQNAQADHVYFRYTNVDVDGYYTFDQVIKIIDETAPVIEAGDETVSITDGAQAKGDDYDDCAASAVLSATVTDMCGDIDLTADGAAWWIEVYNTDGDLIASKTDYGATVSMGSGVGTQGDVHTIKWQVRDGCGNIGTAISTVTFVDDKLPTPVCFQDLSTAIMPSTGTVEIWAKDYDNGSFDNCSEVEHWFLVDADGNPTDDQANGTFVKNLLVTCEMLAEYGQGETLVLGLYVSDAQLNIDFCNITLNVNGAAEVCDFANTSATIAGEISTPQGIMVENAEVALSTGARDMTSVNGTYSFYNNPFATSYELKAEKNDDYLNGVTALDLVLIQKHVLGAKLLDSPYKLIAADVNNDGKVSAIDLVDLRKLILGIYDELPSNDSWRFVDATQQLDATNPFPFAEIIRIDNITADQMEENFFAAKIGDVSSDAVANSSIAGTRSVAGTLNLTAQNAELTEGTLVDVAVNSADFNAIAGYQFTLELNGLEFVAVTPGALNVSDANFAVLDANTVTTTWYSAEAVSTTDDLFTMTFRATSNVSLNDALAISSRVTEAAAYNASLERLDVGMTYNVAGAGFALLQNTPNPFDQYTTIGFELPEAGAATLTVFDVTGKTIHIVDGTYGAGYNELTLSKSDLGTSGVVYYQLESGDFTATQKMVIIE